MFKVLKNLFIYKDPQQKPEEFRFPEDPSESARWNQFIGKNKNSNSDENYNQDNSSNDVTNKIINTIKKNSESIESENILADQFKVHNKLTEILKSNQKNSSGEEKQTQDKDKKDSRTPRVLKAKNIEDLVKGRGIDGKETNEFEEKGNDKVKDETTVDDQKNNDSDKCKNSEKTKSNKNEKNIDIKKSDINSNFKTCGKDEDNTKNKKHSDNSKNDSDAKNNNDESENKKEDDKNREDVKLKNVSTSLEENIKYLGNIYNLPTNKDLIIRKFNIAKRIPACIVYIDGMIDKLIVIQFALPQLMDEHAFRHYDFKCDCPLDYIEKNVLTIHQLVRMNSYDEINPQIVSGLAVLFIDGCDECLVMESRGFERRGIDSPATEQVINGPQEGFTETLRTNITQIRRIVKSENLITEFEFISKKNNFLCAIMYMEGIANRKIVDEVKRRIKNLDVDYISGSGMLEQLIEDKPYMIFPQIVSTERPDRTASFLMEGKVVIICEGTPFALAMPIVFFDLFHTSEESNLRWQYGTFLRIIRLIGLLLATFLPGMYTALILFHQEMIPTSLLSSIVSTRLNVPFPTFLEILLMEFSFELIREGGVRVPGVTGNTLGIIGALILGQAAVEAGLVSPILIIIVAVSGLGSFSIPNYSLSMGIRIVRISFIVFGQIAGFFGISVAFTILCAFALNMKSFGVRFFTPVAPATKSNTDNIIRAPVFDQVRRPDWLNTQDERRAGQQPRGWKSNGGAKS
ncbi:MAG: spore germination protein [Clostridiaceae bacterium]|nr:spore germination protein [Clostridiaceae bacterium]